MPRKTTRHGNRSNKHVKRAAAALTAAGTIAVSTQAYAVPKRFNNPGFGAGHFTWNDATTPPGAIGLNITMPASEQGFNTGPRFYWRHDTFESVNGCHPSGGQFECTANRDDVLRMGGFGGNSVKRLTVGAGQMVNGTGSWDFGQTLFVRSAAYACYYSSPSPNPPGCNALSSPDHSHYFVPIQDIPINGSDFYLGVRFNSTDGTHYGWIGARSSGGLGLDTFAWGYETDPGVPIAAGAVPEPGTLALLAFGATAVASRRRKQTT